MAKKQTNSSEKEEHAINPNTPIQLEGVTVTAEAPTWVKYKQEWEKANPFNIDKYVEGRFNNPVGREAIKKIDQKGWKKQLREEGLLRRYNATMDYVGEQLVKNKPQGKLSRSEWLNQMSDKEEEIIKRNPKYQSSLWVDTKRGLTSLVEGNPLQTFRNILNSSDYTNREKREILKDYVNHPIMSKLGDLTKVLNPLTVPAKMVQSTYKNNYSFTDALKGKKNNAGIGEDIVTDPLNFVGAGLLGKLSKVDKVIDATKVGSKVLNKTDDVVKNIVEEAIPILKKENIYQPSVPFKIEQPTTNTLQLKSTMMGSPIEKQLSKDGMLSINSLQAHLKNPSTSIADRKIIQKVLDEKFAGQLKINYNDFRKAVSDELIPLEKNFDYKFSNYGINKLGYSGAKRESIEESIEQGKRSVADAFSKRNTSSGSRDDVETALEDLRAYQKLLSKTPKENISIVYSNKDKFGLGSTDHFENTGTLGHSRILVSDEEPDIMHILEQQSDYYQKDKYSELLANKKEAIDGGYDQNVIQSWTKKVEDYEKGQINPIQKELLGKTHQERLLQENVAYAAKNGQTKMRYPTPETAAKIQGYEKQISPNRNWGIIHNELQDLRAGKITHKDQLHRDTKSFITSEGDIGLVRGGNGAFEDTPLNEVVNQLESKNLFELAKNKKDIPYIEFSEPTYSTEYQTILKKYNDNPKMVKKVLGQDTRTVTDAKGNTWFEFDIPEAFRKGKAEIKALSTIGAVATGAVATGKTTINNETKYAQGGNMKYTSQFKQGGNIKVLSKGGNDKQIYQLGKPLNIYDREYFKKQGENTKYTSQFKLGGAAKILQTGGTSPNPWFKERGQKNNNK